MYPLILVSIMTNLSEIRTLVYPYEKDISLVNSTLSVLLILAGLIGFVFRNFILNFLNPIHKKFLTPKDVEALVEYNKYFTDNELDKLDTPYIQRIESNIELDVIKEATDFLKSSEQVLIISGESGIGKTRLVIEISKKINKSKKLPGNFKFKGKCLFLNLRHYKDLEDVEEVLEVKLSEKAILVFDDYQYNENLFTKVMNIAFKRNSKLIITTRPIFSKSLKERIGEASIRELKLGRMDIKNIIQDLKDNDLKKGIEKLAGGNPAIALLALDYIKQFPDENVKSIFQSIIRSEEFFNKIIRDFQKEYGEDFIEFLSGRELIGGIVDTDIPDKYEKTVAEMEKNGHIVKYKSTYHLTPEVLSEYLINHEFFTGTILKHSFEELAKEKNGLHIIDILNSIIKIKDEREIYCKAAEKILVTIDKLEPTTEQKIRRIKAGMVVYYAFGNLNLVTERLGEFWADYEILENDNDLFDLSLFLVDISKLYEARKCLEKAKNAAIRNYDKVEIAVMSHNIGNICYIQGNYEEAMELYNQSLKINEELRNKRRILSILFQMGMVYQSQENYEEAMKKYSQGLEISEKLDDKGEIALILHQIGVCYQSQKNYEEAMKKYGQELENLKELRDNRDIVRRVASISLKIAEIYEAQENYEKAVKKYNDTLEMLEKLDDKRGILSVSHNLGNLFYTQKKYDEAAKKYNKSLKIAKELDDKIKIAISLHHLGMTHEMKTEYVLALKNYLRAYSILKESESPILEQAEKDISNIKNKVGDEEFTALLENIQCQPVLSTVSNQY